MNIELFKAIFKAVGQAAALGVLLVNVYEVASKLWRSRFLTHLCSPKADPPSARLFVIGRARRTSS